MKVSDLKYKKIEEQFPQMHDLAKNMLLKARMNVLRILAVRTRDEYRDVEKNSWNIFLIIKKIIFHRVRSAINGCLFCHIIFSMCISLHITS